jgi:poly(A) polymerase
MNFPGPAQISEICRELIGRGFRLYFYGSTVRSMLLREHTAVFFVLTDADLVELARLHEDMEFPGRSDFDCRLKLADLVICFKIFTAPRRGIDFPFLRDLTAEQQLTIDSLFYDPSNGSYLDPWSAYYDLRKKVLSPLPHFDTAFPHHPHLMLEALELFSTRGFSIAEELMRHWERQRFPARQEDLDQNRKAFSGIMTSHQPYGVLMLMERLHIMTSLFPDLETMRDVPQDKDHHPEGNVFEHTLECFKYIEKPSLALSLGLLFHDIGKPSTLTFDRNVRFPDHARIGARKARHILRKFGYQSQVIDDCAFLIEHHLLWREFARRDEKGKKALMSHSLFPELMRLYRADISSCFGDFDDYNKISSLYKKHRKTSTPQGT